LVKSPDSNLHFLVSPEIALHLITGWSGSGQCWGATGDSG